MSNIHVSVDGFSGAVAEIYKNWSVDVIDTSKEAVKEVAEESRDQLKVEGDFSNRTGKYRKGWKITFEETRYDIKATVHNKVYQLTHLLESGHAKFLWGRATGEEVRAFPHIANVNDEAQRKLEEEIVRRINDL